MRPDGTARHRHYGCNSDSRIKWQYVMRQFGRNRLEDNPGWHRPSEHKSKAVLATVLPNIGCRKGGERRSGPESSEEGDEIKTGRGPVMLLPRRNLAE